jgi:hypothetical protein
VRNNWERDNMDTNNGIGEINNNIPGINQINQEYESISSI